ncbi:MAG: DNA-3-methyladenine glycosylase [Gemmatimonadota bacterium]|nr:DNA-3-methyladenine glycosylase [Gemmatimonadota bacterium]
MAPRHAAALRHLRAMDPKLGAWIDQVGPCGWRRNTEGDHFDHIARAIVYQQLSGAAAATIHGRLLALYGDRTPTPAELMRTPHNKLRAVGLSERKAEYLKDLARRTHEGTLPVERLHELDDAEVLDTLTAVRGIGEWTAQMFLMFRLARPDVLPVLDLGVQKAVKLVYGLRSHPSPKRVAKIGACWAPYRTVASWYLWRRVDDPPQ